VKAEYHHEARSLLVDFGFEATVLSSTSGISRSRYAIVVYVSEDADEDDIVEAVERAVRRLGLPSPTPIFATAVEEGEHIVASGPGVHVVATVGLRPAACITPWEGAVYQCARGRPGPATINLLGVIEEPELTMTGLLDAYRVLAEAKAAAATLAPLHCASGIPLGTVSDAIAVAGRVSEGGCKWSGPATQPGWRLARLAIEAVLAATKPDPLGYIGVTIGDVVDDALKLYSTAPVPGAGSVKPRVEALARRVLGDPNAAAVIVASALLDRYAAWGMLPGLSGEEHRSDSRGVIADELLASALAVYVNGFRGLLAAYWADRNKERLGLKLSRLPMFSDDAIAGLVGAILSRVYDELLGGA
jgi:alpha-ribazole phosphatase CobZ